MRHVFFYSLIAILLFSCVEPLDKAFSKLPPGIWRGVLVLDNTPPIFAPDDEVTIKKDYSGELPFNFEVKYTDNENFYIEIHNADERITVSDIVYGRDKATAKDTIIINFPVFDTYIKAIYEDDIMEGDLYVNYKENYQIPFKAYFGQSHRFTTLKKKPKMDISGKWEVKFEVDTDDEYPAVGEFVQEGNRVTGTFMTETGDYRYLEGTIQDQRIFLSTFDAAHAFLFEAKLLDDNSLIGSFRSGKHYTTTWSAIKNDNAKLGDAFELTTSKIADQPFDFTFDDLNGKKVSLSDEQFNDKIKLVKISGTWCPNCKDESLFLIDYLNNNPSEDIAVIEVAFERYKNELKAKEVLKRYKEKMQLPFTVLYGGFANKALASEKFPQITNVLSYPTLIFVDKTNRIRHIHTGFAGPATSEFPAFEQKFKNLINELREDPKTI
ncbi:MAG: TlpA disulfide reductase family protein [Bacteroidota bacterium]